MKAKFSKKNEWFLPSWLFVAVMTVVYEVYLHLGSMDSFLLPRFGAVLAFAFGFAALTGLISSFFSGKAQKWAGAVLTFLLAVVYLVEFYVHDAYQVFMTPGSILNGAEGVMTNYFSIVANLLRRSFWKILLLLHGLQRLRCLFRLRQHFLFALRVMLRTQYNGGSKSEQKKNGCQSLLLPASDNNQRIGHKKRGT